MTEKAQPPEIETIKQACAFCHRPIIGTCGTWTAETSGCCVVTMWKKVLYVHERKAHAICLLNAKNKKPKNLRLLKEEDTMKELEKINKEIQKKIKNWGGRK